MMDNVFRVIYFIKKNHIGVTTVPGTVVLYRAHFD